MAMQHKKIDQLRKIYCKKINLMILRLLEDEGIVHAIRNNGTTCPLNKERAELPDIDIDLAPSKRNILEQLEKNEENLVLFNGNIRYRRN